MRYARMELPTHSALLAFIVVTPWKIVGLTGSAVFSVRFFLQWIASERAKKSIIPVGFWECSLLGSALALSYFIFYRHDSVGVIMTLAPLPLYIRNLYLKWREVLTEKTTVKPSEAKTEEIAAQKG
ncbi:MAG TPA: lipid-A-disaccharide synthase N-terminal domain-containing protein [Chthoniobacterales bacterium]|nr:lipid-A-disaccharide synthase N-terminal domain-containing protein [Chthoniobacterales bacterium]